MSKEITVAFFGETIYPAHNIKWINHIASLTGIKAIVFTTNKDASHISKDVEIYTFSGLYPVFRASRRRALKAEFDTILQKHNVDVLHFLWGMDLPMWINALDYPSIITTRGSDVLKILQDRLNIKFSLSKEWLGNYLMLRLHRKAYTKAKAITSTSIKQQEKIKNFVPDVKNMHLIRTGVVIEEFFSDIPLSMDKDNLVIFSPRTMKPIYNQAIILRAFHKLLKDYPNSKLRMINNYPDSVYGKEIKKQIKSLDIEHSVVLLPSLSSGQMHQEYINSDIVVMIPKTDGTAVSSLESMLSLRPLIIGHYDYDKDLFGSDFVWKLPQTTEEELLKKIIEIINTPNNKLSEKITRAQKNAMNRSDRVKEMQKIVSLYRTIVK